MKKSRKTIQGYNSTYFANRKKKHDDQCQNHKSKLANQVTEV